MPSFRQRNNPLTMINTQNYQLQDVELANRFRNDPVHCVLKRINGSDAMCYREHESDPDWKICLPVGLLPATLEWYHLTLGHCGIERLYDTIRSRFHHPGLSVACQKYRCPVNCQMCKSQGRSYGHHGACEAPIALHGQLKRRRGVSLKWRYQNGGTARTQRNGKTAGCCFELHL